MATQKLEESIVLGEMIPLRKHDNKASNYEFTIVVPVFNDEDNMLALEEKLSVFVSESLLDTCVLFVSDCSIDQSKERIIEVCSRQKHFYQKNSGLSAELKEGIDATRSKFVGYIDADLQITRKDFHMLIPYVEEYGLVMGIRVMRDDSFIKRASYHEIYNQRWSF